MNKKGISLMVLVVTIILLLILLSVTTITVGNIVQNSTKSAFASDLASLKDAADVYYIRKGELPVKQDNSGKVITYEYNDTEMKNANDTSNSISLSGVDVKSLKNEFVLNGDYSNGEQIVSDTVFYALDLNKLNVEKTKRGTGNNGLDDVYVISYPSLTVYYLKGVKVDGVTYFSIYNLIEYNKIGNNESSLTSNDEVVITELSGITVKREKKAWTNTLDITIEAYLNDLEEIYVRLPGKSDIKLNTVAGQNTILLKSLSGSLQLTQDEIDAFYKLKDSERNIIVVKKSNGVESGSVKINIANYDINVPIVPLKSDGKTFDFNIASNDGYNVVSFVAKDDLSGIKEVRYVYLTEFNKQGILQSIHFDEKGNEIKSFSSEYMLQNGKKAYVEESGKVNINLPKDIEAIYIAMYDKAGNCVLVTKNVASDIYAGINLVGITSDLIYSYAINTKLNVTKVTTSISSDGITFENEKVLTLTKNDNGVYFATNNFVNNNYKEAYVKVVVETDTLKETRIKKIDVSEKAYELINSVIPGIIYNENKYYTDSNGDKAILPVGFKVSSKIDEQTIDDGLVILDMQDNEYVWIPCTIDGADGTIKYAKWNGSKNTDYTVTKEQVEDDTLPTGITSETEQIIKYGGFYVARYEAGLPDTQTTEELMLTKTFSAADNNRTDIGKAQSKADKIVWNRISYTNAKTVSETVISNDYVQSGLITGTQWDTMLTFISDKVNVDTDCTAWGNYKDKYGYTINGYYRTQHADIAYTKGQYTKTSEGYLLLQTGKFGSVIKLGSPKNLYDVAGNVWEWSAETVTQKGGCNTSVGNKLLRGGGSADYGSDIVASLRDGINAATVTNPYVGFRFVLYVK